MDQEKNIKVTTLKQYIEELQNNQQELVKKFDDKNKEIESTVANYIAKMEVIQKEGEQVVEGLNNEKEQIRGSYQTLSKLVADIQAQLDNLLDTNSSDNAELSKESSIEAKVINLESKSTRKTKLQKKVEDDGLTAEQIQAIKEISDNDKQSEQLNNKTSHEQTLNTSDIPEYLLDEYKK